MDSRQQFEEWYKESGMTKYKETALAAWEASRESLVVELPEVTKEHVQFALNCQMEDPNDDEEIGFCEGVSWCLSFLKQQIAKREKK